MSLIDALDIQGKEILSPSASPSWWGADSVRRRVELRDGRVLIDRQMAPGARVYSSPSRLVRAAVAAGAAGLGPEVVAADSASGELLMVELAAPWRNATIDDFLDERRLAQLGQTLSAVRAVMEPDATPTSVFSDVRSLLERLQGDSPALPVDFGWLCDRTLSLEAWVPTDPSRAVFCHNSGDSSNILLAPEQMCLVDWDLARTVDPLQEVGIMLEEFSYLPIDDRHMFSVLDGGGVIASKQHSRSAGV